MSFSYFPILLSGTAGGGGGGGGGVGGGLITVGISGMFPTISEALTNWHNVLFINSDTTEASDVTVPESGLTITILPGAELAMGSNTFLMNGRTLGINGAGTLSFSYSTPTNLFDGDDGSKLVVDGITIDNNGSAISCLTDIDYARFSNVRFDGSVFICSDYNVLNGCIYSNGNISIAANADGTLINGSILEGVLMVDSGNGSVMSDGVVV